ncbi:MAG: hypothetical protein V3S55_06280 [Nitrospiraceae bacterium]
MNTRRQQPEQIFQRQVAQFLTLALPTPEAWFTTIPAGGGGKTRGAILKGMGYKAGTPDMLVIYRRGLLQTSATGPGSRLSETTVIWLEFKAPNKWPTKVQKQCRDDLIAAGCKWALCRTLEDVERALRHFGMPLRATVGGVVGEAA